jgi:hypothetical protein
MKRKVIYKVISKTKSPLSKGRRYQSALRRKGFTNVGMTDYKTVGRGRRLRGVGLKVYAFKGRKKTPIGFKSSSWEF